MKAKHPECRFGHELTRENTRRVAGEVVCLTCADEVLAPVPDPATDSCGPHRRLGCVECQRRVLIAERARALRDQELAKPLPPKFHRAVTSWDPGSPSSVRRALRGLTR